MLNNGYLHLITWLIEHTEITEEEKTTAEELKTAYLLEDNVPDIILKNNRLNSRIGFLLYSIYGTDLKKVRSGAKPVIYNVSYSANKVRTVSILGADLIE